MSCRLCVGCGRVLGVDGEAVERRGVLVDLGSWTDWLFLVYTISAWSVILRI